MFTDSLFCLFRCHEIHTSICCLFCINRFWSHNLHIITFIIRLSKLSFLLLLKRREELKTLAHLHIITFIILSQHKGSNNTQSQDCTALRAALHQGIISFHVLHIITLNYRYGLLFHVDSFCATYYYSSCPWIDSATIKKNSSFELDHPNFKQNSRLILNSIDKSAKAEDISIQLEIIFINGLSAHDLYSILKFK